MVVLISAMFMNHDDYDYALIIIVVAVVCAVAVVIRYYWSKLHLHLEACSQFSITKDACEDITILNAEHSNLNLFKYLQLFVLT